MAAFRTSQPLVLCQALPRDVKGDITPEAKMGHLRWLCTSINDATEGQPIV